MCSCVLYLLHMLMFCTVLTFGYFFRLGKTGVRMAYVRDSTSLVFILPVIRGLFFPMGIKLSIWSEVSNDHFEFFDAFTQGYEEVSQKFTSIRRVRGDNYCALRATLFQAMSQPAALPPWLQDPELTLVRCCRRFESVVFPIVFVRKLPSQPGPGAGTVHRMTSACGLIWFWVAEMIFHNKVTKNDCNIPEEKRGKMYLNGSAEFESWCLWSVKSTSGLFGFGVVSAVSAPYAGHLRALAGL